jgi:septum formation protein
MTVALPPLIILASGSPRRRELLRLLGVRFTVRPADVDETPNSGEPPDAYAVRLAATKAAHVARSTDGTPVLGADTVVAVDGRILGKPADDDDARDMLRQLSGRPHRVHTAVGLSTNGAEAAILDTAMVRFRPLNASDIDWYVATGEPADKAGAYAVQGAGGFLVEAVEGSPQTVIGLPIHRLPELFAACGLELATYMGAGEPQNGAMQRQRTHGGTGP